MTRLKIVLIGPKGCGKTTWVRSLLNMEPVEYKRTMGVEVHMIKKYGHVLEIWDTAGDSNVGGLRGGYYVNADAIVLMGNPTEYFEEEINYMKSNGICRETTPVISEDKVFNLFQ
jgi:GTP-binding nuclear protein Ran